MKKLIGIANFTISKIPIYLVPDANSKDKEISASFSWTPKKSFINIEIPLGLEVPNGFFPISILAHEFFHLMLRKNKSLFLEIEKITQENEKLFVRLSKGMPSRMFLEELLVSSFIPEGYLSEKYLNTKSPVAISNPKDLLSWRKLVAFKSREMAKNYIDNIQQIDKKYLEHIVDI
ncbi:MAG: hypothetical protein Q7S78_00190 [Candidatus Azambacteria bacterium]|nr:hypothetical protein [Candidatus Azambacteria bacterium]